MKLTYFNQNIKLLESFNHPDVIVEVPFKFGYVKYFPYYNEAEAVVNLNKLSKFEKIRITDSVIPHSAVEALNQLNEKNVYNFIFANKEAANRALKYEFADLYFKLISLAREKTKLFGELRINDGFYCETSLDELSVKFKHPYFFFVLKQNENGELVTSFAKKLTTDSVYRLDIQNVKQLLNENLDKFKDIQE